MVEGRREIDLPLAGTLTVVDLDGTLVRGNTLHVFMRCALKAMIRQKRLYSAMRLCTLAVLRKMHIISHRRMKFDLLNMAHIDDSFKNEFVRTIKLMIRHSVSDELDRCRRDGSKILLATAAADIYVPWIWNEDYIATPIHDNPDRIECRGIVKARAVSQYAEKNGMKIHTVLTDHIDDLPLLSLPGVRRVLVAPSATTLAAVNFAGLSPQMVLD